MFSESRIEADGQDLTAQFGLNHALLWTFLSSIGFLLWSSAFRKTPSLSPLLHVFGVSDAVINAAALTGLIVLLSSRRPWRRIKHPGHWMVVIHATVFLSLLPLQYPTTRLLVSNWVFLGVPSLLYLAATFCSPRPWCFFFAVAGLMVAASHLTPYLPMDMRMGFLSTTSQIRLFTWPCITVLMFVYAIIDTRTRGRDWVHWLGVAVVCLLWLQEICYNTLSRQGLFG